MNITIHRDGHNYGPYSPEQVKEYLTAGSLLANDLAWHEGVSDWLPLSQVPELVTKPPPPPAAVLPPLPILSEVSMLQQTDFALLPNENVYMEDWALYRSGWDHRVYCYVTNCRLCVIKQPIRFSTTITRAFIKWMEKPTKITYQIPWVRLSEITRGRILFGNKTLIFKSTDGQVVTLMFPCTLFFFTKESSWHTAIRRATDIAF
jgi:hypothetical protein